MKNFYLDSSLSMPNLINPENEVSFKYLSQFLNYNSISSIYSKEKIESLVQDENKYQQIIKNPSFYNINKLSAWDYYIKFIMNLIPIKYNEKLRIFLVLELFTKNMYQEKEFYLEHIYISYWIFYADLCKDDYEIFKSLLKKNICTNNPELYVGLSYFYEKYHAFSLANEYYLKGFENQIQSDNYYHKIIKEFEKRMENRINREINKTNIPCEEIDKFVHKKIFEYKNNENKGEREIKNIKMKFRIHKNKIKILEDNDVYENEIVQYDNFPIYIDENCRKKISKKNESYLLANFYYYSSFQNFSNSNYIYSNELSINEKNSTLLQLKGSCNESFFNSVTLISQRVNFSATDFKISNCSEQNYTLNVTFNITSILNEKEEYNIIIEYNETKFEIINDIYTQIENTKIYGHQTIPIINCSGKNISNENQIECINCSSIKKYYSEKFKNLQECEPTEYFCSYLNECYSKCDLNNTICKYKYETNKIYIEDCEETNEDLKNSNEDNDCKCIYKNFEVDKINSNTEDTININWNENITLNITFKENFTNPLRIEITTEKDSIEYSSKSECNKITNESENIYNCTINMRDFSFFGYYNILYNITFKNESYDIFNLTEKQNKKIKLEISEEYCGKSYQILNKNSQCEYCPDKQNYYNLNCHDNCSDDLYRFHNESINKYICLTKEECNNININNMTYKIEANKNGNYCLNECDNGYGIYNNNNKECIYCKEEEGFGSLNGKCEKCYEHNSIVADSGECVCDIGYEKKKMIKT